MEPPQGKLPRGVLGLLAVLVLIAAVGLYLSLPRLHSRPQPGPTPSPPIALHVEATAFPTSDSAWVALSDTSGRAALFVTTDRGDTWKRKLALPKGMHAQSLQFIREKSYVLVAGGGATGGPPQSLDLYITADAGDHWNHVSPQGLPTSFVSASFTDTGHGWMTGSSPGTASVVGVYRTSDGGGTWGKVADLPAYTQISGFVGTRASFVSNSVGWVATITRGQEPMLYPDPFVYGTQDGGYTWERQPLPAPPTGWPQGFAIFSAAPVCFAGKCVVSSTLSNASGGTVVPRSTYVYKSNDSGRSWTGPIMVPGQSSDVYFANPDTWWTVALASTPKLAATTDGGRTWSTVSPELPTSVVALSGVVIESPQVAWAVSLRPPNVTSRGGYPEPVLLRTTSAGAKWSEIGLPTL